MIAHLKIFSSKSSQIKIDYKKAFNYFQAAINSNELDKKDLLNAQFKLGMMYFNGNGVKQNHQEARKLLDIVLTSQSLDDKVKNNIIYNYGLAYYDDKNYARPKENLKNL